MVKVHHLVIMGCALLVLILAFAQLGLMSKAAEDTLEDMLDWGHGSGKFHDKKGHGKHHKKLKVGAGFMMVTPAGKALLLKRNSKHHGGTWGLPGGNVEHEDSGDLVQTAVREAVEELGVLPTTYSIQGSFVTMRGKRKQKQYTVYVALVPEDVAAQYKPDLDPEEHTAWQWFGLTDLLHIQSKLLSSAGGGKDTSSTAKDASSGEDDSKTTGTLQSTTSTADAAAKPAASGGLWQHFVDMINQPHVGMAQHHNQAGGGSQQEGAATTVTDKREAEEVELHPVVMLALGPDHLSTVKQLIKGSAVASAP